MWTYAFLFSSLLVAGDTLLPQRASVISSTRLTYTCRVHLNESFFHTALPTAISLNDSGLKGDPFGLGYLQGNVPGSGGEVAAVVAAPVPLALLITLVPGRLGQLLCLGLQQLVEGFLYAASYQLVDLPLDYSSLICTIFSGMVCSLLSKWCLATSFYQRTANHVSFYLLFILRNLFFLITAEVEPLKKSAEIE